MQAKGPLLKARLVSAAEVHFILAEAAQKGWSAGDAKTHYEAAVKASLTAWGLTSSYATFIAQKGVVLRWYTGATHWTEVDCQLDERHRSLV